MKNCYTPSGYNDNNMGRANVPSNIFPKPSTGNPFGQFNPNGPFPNTRDFKKAYSEPVPMIEPINYNNQNNIIHNNISSSVLNETIVEYKINIDSLDRDIRLYPNPFNYIVKFNTLSSEYIGKSYFPAAPGPLINKELKNVKYIRLDNIVLPQYSNNKFSKKKDEYVLKNHLLDDRFVTLEIEELTDLNVYSSSESAVRLNPITGNSITPPKPFGLIIPDTRLGKYYYSGVPYNANKIYNPTDLGNIKKLSIKFYDSYGVPLGYDNLFTFKELEEAAIKGCPLPTCDVRHPLNKNIQNHLSFVIGISEAHINNLVKYEK